MSLTCDIQTSKTEEKELSWNQYSRFAELSAEIGILSTEIRTTFVEEVNKKNDQLIFNFAVKNQLCETMIFYANYRKVRIIATDITQHMLDHVLHEQFVHNIDPNVIAYPRFRELVTEIETFRANNEFCKLCEILGAQYVNKQLFAKFALKHKLIELAKCYKLQEYITLCDLFHMTRKDYAHALAYSSLCEYPRAHSLGREIELTKRNASERISKLEKIIDKIENCTDLKKLHVLNMSKNEIEFDKASEILRRYEQYVNNSPNNNSHQLFFNYAIENNLRETALYMYLCLGCVVCTQFEEIVRKIEENAPVRGMGELETKLGVSSCLNLHYGASGAGKKASIQKIFEGLRIFSCYGKYYDGTTHEMRKFGHQFKKERNDRIWGSILPPDPIERVEESFVEPCHRDFNIDNMESLKEFC